MADRIVYQVTDGVAHVELARPEKMNAIDLDMIEALITVPDKLRQDNSVRCVVLSGQGRAFCAGLDTSSFATMASDPEQLKRLMTRHPGSIANRAQQAVYGWSTLPVPVVAAVHGACFGGGLQIALAADIRLVAPDAKLSVMEVKWGLIPDMTGVQAMKRLMALDVIKELTYTGRVVSGEEAVSLNLATRVTDDPRAAAQELAATIAGKSPHAIRAGKKLLDASGELALEAALKLEEELQVSLMGTPNQIEAVMANMQKRPPSFAEPEA